MEKFQLKDGAEAWSFCNDQYVKAAVETIKNLLAEDGHELKGGKRPHKNCLPPNCKPELDDVTKECSPDMVS